MENNFFTIKRRPGSAHIENSSSQDREAIEVDAFIKEPFKDLEDKFSPKKKQDIRGEMKIIDIVGRDAKRGKKGNRKTMTASKVERDNQKYIREFTGKN